jgi:hypothetical protein
MPFVELAGSSKTEQPSSRFKSPVDIVSQQNDRGFIPFLGFSILIAMAV